MKTQNQKLRELFESREGQWVPLPNILLLGIAQYGTRIFELRREGMNIKNKTKMIDGTKRSWYMYVREAKEDLFDNGS